MSIQTDPRILWVTTDRSMRVATHFETFQARMAELTEVSFIRKNLGKMLAGDFIRAHSQGRKVGETNLLEKVNHLGQENYDILICDSIFAFPWDSWRKIKIPKACILEDMHTTAGLQVQTARKMKFDFIFYRYQDAWRKRYGNLFDKTFWLPHCVNTEYFQDYRLEKNIDALLVGVTSPRVYPFRHKASIVLNGKPFFKQIPRPPETPHKTQKWPIRDDYGRLLNSAKLVITGGSCYHYPVMKYFEIPACNSLLFSDWFPELRDLGFQKGYNIAISDLHNLEKDVKWWLNNESERKEVSRNGMELILKKHTLEIRALQFLNRLKEIL